MMSQLLIVGAGGFLGSILRYVIGSFVQQSAMGVKFPVGTFAVNLIGCLIIGFLAQLAERSFFHEQTKLFLFVGVLGGFTTFSSFGNETIDLWRANKNVLVVVNVAGHVVICLAAVCLGRLLATRFVQVDS